MVELKQLKGNLTVFILLGMCILLGCAAEKHNIRDTSDQPLPPFSLYPIPLKGQTQIDDHSVRIEKMGVVVEMGMDKFIMNNGVIYLLKIGVTNLIPSILTIDPQKTFVRTSKSPTSSFIRLTGEMVIEFCRNQASADYHDYLGKKYQYDALMSSQKSAFVLYGALLSHKKEKELSKKLEGIQILKNFAEKELLFPTQLPRAGSVEGGILFFPKYYPSSEEDLFVQFYVGEIEFVFRFSETVINSPPDSELIIDSLPSEEI